ncbi:MAG: hypothetical protein ACK5F7_04655, partial [Planctomycetaceae bacterium]
MPNACLDRHGEPTVPPVTDREGARAETRQRGLLFPACGQRARRRLLLPRRLELFDPLPQQAGGLLVDNRRR